MNGLFDNNLNNPNSPIVPDEEIKREINEANEKEYLAKISKKNKKGLIKLDIIERERIAKHICDLYNQNISSHNEKCDKIDKYDEIFRMVPENTADSDTPNYRSPLSTVTLETIHANYMNVFFTPKDVARALPTEPGDTNKISKLDTFMNWSMTNEMDLFANCDRLFHSSSKNGENPYMVHWVKEYGTEIKKEPIMNPMNPGEPLLDEETGEIIYQEREESKVIYDGPKLEVFSRKDYILPENAVEGKKLDWEMRRVRLSADTVLRNELKGKYYKGVFDEIGGWGVTSEGDTHIEDKEGNQIPLGKDEKIFIMFFGNLRVNAIKDEKEGDEVYEELEDEFIAVVEIKSQTLCELRKNRFPFKERPIGLDLCIPDDEGRMEGTGIIEFMSGPQSCYDALYNQYIFGTTQSNNPFGFFTPFGNTKKEPIKVKSGTLYPSPDPGGVNIIKLPPPDNSLLKAMEETRNWAQLLFGISDYQAGVESQIDPSAPAKKAEIVLAQGNVRLNLIIKRKNKTIKDILRRWFLLYRENMPKNKLMRITGEEGGWTFQQMTIEDFNLKSIPDFELTGNILNANKTLEAQKAISIYQILIQNPFFSPQIKGGVQSLHALTKWLMDKLDETGISRFIPQPKEMVATPEEENARFMQGDEGDPTEGEDHVYHIKIHQRLLLDPTIDDKIKSNVIKHIQKTTDLMKKELTARIVMSQIGGAQNVPVPERGIPSSGGLLQERGMGTIPQANNRNAVNL